LQRKTRFLVGLILVASLFALPIIIAITVNALWTLALFTAGFFASVYWLYRITIRNIKPRYPLVNPEGHPDIYSGRMPRPIYEDVERYPWFFKKKRKKTADNTKKVRKKH
jgi:hypothetical protein